MELDIENIWEEICNDLCLNLYPCTFEEYLISWNGNEINCEIKEETFFINNEKSKERNDGKKKRAIMKKWKRLF